MFDRIRNFPWQILFVTLAAAIVLCGSRLWLQEFPNVKPVTGICLLVGLFYRDLRWGLAVPMLGMLGSDLIFGFAEPLLMLTIYGSLVLNVLIGRCCFNGWYAKGVGSRIGAATLAVLLATLQFFWITNLAVWGFTPWYPKTCEGLWACMVNALPFLRYSLIGDFLFAWCPLIGMAIWYREATERNREPRTCFSFSSGY